MACASDAFVDMSAALTGFSRVELIGTGVSDQYEAQLEAALPTGLAADFLAAFGDAAASANGAAAELLGDDRWGPVARSVITMWYMGTWSQLPAAWRAEYGDGEGDVTRVVSPDSYVNALHWVAAGAHPVGARQQGFGAWATPPEDVATSVLASRGSVS